MGLLQQFQTRWSAIRWPIPLAPQVVNVVRIHLDMPPERWNALSGNLSPDEIERANRFRFDEPRRRFIVCRATLRHLLGTCCDVSPSAVPLRYGNQGKPELSFDEIHSKQPQLEFSVSHSGEFGLIAIAINSPVGVDVEECNPKVKTIGLAERIFSPAESLELSNLPLDEQLAGFYRGWTCKEAYIKATGRGLSYPLNSFSVSIDPKKPAALLHIDDLPNEPHRWTIQSLDVAEQYAGAVMVAQPDCHVECWDWPSA